MAQKVHITLEDDIDGSPAEETVTFGLDGKSYEIDLSDKNASKLRSSLERFIEAGRRSGTNGVRKSASAGPRRLTAVGPSAREVRDWARTNNIEIPDRGRIPETVRAQFEAAH